jgi:hypothetical protein
MLSIPFMLKLSRLSHEPGLGVCTAEAPDVRKNPRRLTVVVYIRSIVKRGARAEL